MQTIDDCDGAICIPCAGTPLPVCTNTSVVACDDGDPCTENDMQTDDCDGAICIPCAGTPGLHQHFGCACDDGDPCTENDTQTIDDCDGAICVPCAGTPIACLH